MANAVEATIDGGRILIGTALEHRLDPDADTTLQRGYVTLSVCDEGHGMAADIAERASEPFFTTRTSAGQRPGPEPGVRIHYPERRLRRCVHHARCRHDGKPAVTRIRGSNP